MNYSRSKKKCSQPVHEHVCHTLLISTDFGRKDPGLKRLTPKIGLNDDTGYPHDGRADKDSYPHDGRADKDSYLHDRHNQ